MYKKRLIVQSYVVLKPSRYSGYYVISLFISFLSKTREKIRLFFGSSLAYPQNELVLGILLGSASSLPVSLTKQLRKVGLTHIVSASGYNISVFLQVFERIFQHFPRAVQVFLSLLLVCAYSIMAGLSPSIVRATGMTMQRLFSITSGKQYNSLWSLYVVSCTLLTLRPYYIVDAGFLLSFFATGCLSLLHPIEQYAKVRLGDSLFTGLINLFITCSCISISTAPIILAISGEFSPYGIAANIFSLWIINPILWLSLTMTWLVFFNVQAKLLFVPLAELLDLFLKLVRFFSSIAERGFVFKNVSFRHLLIWFLLSYSLIFSAYLCAKKLLRSQKMKILAVGIS